MKPWVIIRTYKRPRELRTCLAAVETARIPWAQVFVASNQATRPAIPGFAKDANLIHKPYEIPKGKGPGTVTQMGVDAATAAGAALDDCFVVLDDDVYLAANLLECWDSLTAKLAEPDCGIVQLKTYRVGWKKEILVDEYHVVDFVGTAGGMLITRRVLEDAGGFSDNYFDDVEIAVRLAIKGYKCYRYRGAASVHRATNKHGGLDAVYGKRTAQQRIDLSGLDKLYPGIVEPDIDAWFCYRFVKGWKERVHERVP